MKVFTLAVLLISISASPAFAKNISKNIPDEMMRSIYLASDGSDRTPGQIRSEERRGDHFINTQQTLRSAA